MKWLPYKFRLTLRVLVLTSRQTLLRADLDESKRKKKGKLRCDYLGKEKNLMEVSYLRLLLVCFSSHKGHVTLFNML